SVADDGTVSINGGNVIARVNADSSGFVGYQAAGQDPEILVGMKDGAGPYSNASLVGSYSATNYIFTGPALQQPHLIADINALPMDLILNQAPPVGFRTEYLTVT